MKGLVMNMKDVYISFGYFEDGKVVTIPTLEHNLLENFCRIPKKGEYILDRDDVAWEVEGIAHRSLYDRHDKLHKGFIVIVDKSARNKK